MDFVGISSNNFWNFDEIQNVAEMTVFQYISSRECHFGSTLKASGERVWTLYGFTYEDDVNIRERV